MSLLSVGHVDAQLHLSHDSSLSQSNLQWQGDSGFAYWVERAPDLATWADISQPLVGRASVLNHVDAVAWGGQGFYRLRLSTVLAESEFATDPRLTGWTYMNELRQSQATGGYDSGGRIQPGAGTGKIWRGTSFVRPAHSYYRVDFKARSSNGSAGIVWVSGIGLNTGDTWGRYFRNGDLNTATGELWADDWVPYAVDTNWSSFVYYSRVRPNALSSTVYFWDFGGVSPLVDDVVVTAADAHAVLNWADAIYATLPAVNYSPPAARHSALSRSMPLLEAGSTLRIVLVGDSIAADTGNSTFDLLLQRAYPGSQVQLSIAGASATGMDKWNSLTPYAPAWPDGKDINLVAAVIEQQPDLVVLTGISNGRDWNVHFPAVIDKIRDECETRYGYEPDVLITPGPYPYLTGDPSAQISDFASIAANQGTAFFDLYGATKAYFDALPGTGYVVADFYRDPVHANLIGKQVLGRVLLEWFLPD